MVALTILETSDAAPFMDLLLLADPSEAMIMQHVADGHLFVAQWDGVTVGVFVLLPLEDILWELKNIAVAPEWQGKGVGRKLLACAIQKAKAMGAAKLEVGTGNSSVRALVFYEKAGFIKVRTAKNFFMLNYDKPIYEDGIQCTDMIILSLDLVD